VLAPGITLRDRYQLEERLGRTAAGRQTWRVQDLETNEAAIIKLLAFSPQMEWQELELFEREAKTLQSLQHDRIPNYRDYFDLSADEGGGLPWFALVQDYIDGPTLQQAIDGGDRRTEAQVKAIARELLDILIYLHDLSPPVLHRDIKPSNIILAPATGPEGLPRPYLIDFGAVQAEAALTGITFTVVGTSGYAPLEQFWGRAVPASDLYALGATLVHWLTGTVPASLPQRDSRLQFRDRVSASEDLILWLEQMTEPAVEKRFTSARAARDALDHPRPYRPVPRDRAGSPLAARNIREPADHRIELRVQAGRLSITYPGGNIGRRFRRLGLFTAKGCLLAIALNYLGILFVLVALPIYGLFSFERIHICLDRDRFECHRTLFGFKYALQHGSTQHILGVFLNSVGQTYELSFRAENQTYRPGGILDDHESAWLAQEIERWLRYESF
jgi:serine/threonine protein kinase